MDVWHGALNAVHNYARSGGRNVTYPLGMDGGGVGSTWVVDHSNFAIVDTGGVVQFITSNSVPCAFALSQNAFDPFLGQTLFHLTISAAAVQSSLQFAIYDLLGRRVRQLARGCCRWERILSSGIAGRNRVESFRRGSTSLSLKAVASVWSGAWCFLAINTWTVLAIAIARIRQFSLARTQFRFLQ